MILLASTEREYPWGVLRSTHASKVKFALALKELDWKVLRLAPGDLWKKPAGMLEKHPLGKVPWIEEDGFVVFDSTVILEYLEERHPQRPLLPKDVSGRARARMLETWVDEALLIGALPAIWMPMWVSPEKRDGDAMKTARERLASGPLAWLEAQFADGRQWLGGDTPTIADTGMAAAAMVLQVDATPMEAFPALAAYLERLRALPAYAAIDPRTSLDASESSAS
ncbi:MAG TPA: glutathione S-transferase family protein [Pseudomonadales bacterium]|nr:glutathione S-transferase family protein [Pseudomonadales bacterium]